MKKVNIALLRSRFDDGLTDIDSVLENAVGLSAEQKRFLTESALLSAAVRWEGFVHELFVAYVNHDATRLSANLLNRLRDSAKAKHGDTVASFIRFSMPKHLSRDKAHLVLDHEYRNVTFSDAAAMVQRASEWLPNAAAKKFAALSKSDRAAIDAWKAVRDFLAHRSESSCDRMNDALHNADLSVAFRRGQHRIKDIAAHFESRRLPDKRPRVRVMLRAMRRIASKL